MSVIREQIFQALAAFQTQPIRCHYPNPSVSFFLQFWGHLSVTAAIGLFIEMIHLAQQGNTGFTVVFAGFRANTIISCETKKSSHHLSNEKLEMTKAL